MVVCLLGRLGGYIFEVFLDQFLWPFAQLAMVAEELDVELDAVKIEHGPASYAYYNEAVLEEAVPFLPTDHGMVAETMRGFTKVPAKFLALQITGGSSTTPDGFVKMRKAGAAARTVLVQAAAQKLGVSESNLKTENGHVIAPDGTKVHFDISLDDDGKIKALTRLPIE